MIKIKTFLDITLISDSNEYEFETALSESKEDTYIFFCNESKYYKVSIAVELNFSVEIQLTYLINFKLKRLIRCFGLKLIFSKGRIISKKNLVFLNCIFIFGETNFDSLIFLSVFSASIKLEVFFFNI